MSDSIANGGCCSGSVRPGTYGNAYDVAQITVDKCGRITKISNVAISGGGGGSSQWTGTKGDPIYYVPYVGIGSSVTPTANLQVTGNVYVSNAVTTPNVHVTDTLDVLGSMTANAANATFFFDTFTIPYINTQYLNVASNIVLTGNLSAPLANITTLNVQYLYANSAIIYGTSTLNVYGISNLSTTTINGGLSVTRNVYAANAVTTTNVFATRYYGDGGLLSNISSSSIVQPFANLVVSNSVTTTNVFATTANVGTLNVWQISNLSTLSLTNNLYASNVFANYVAITGTSGSNVFLFSNVSGGSNVMAMDSNATVVIGIPPSSNVNYGQGYTRTAKARLIINSGGNATYPINLSLVGSAVQGSSYNNGIDFGGGGQGCAQIVHLSIGGGNGALAFYFNNSNGADGNIGEYFRMSKTGLSVFTNATARSALDVAGNIYASNAVTTTNIFTTNVTATGIQTIAGLTGQTTLNVTGNVYVSNALTTTNVFANTEILTGTTGQTTLNVTGNLYVSNAVTTTNITCAGFTSNISNTIFNYDTLTIPFVSCTTLNVASTANVLTLSIPGSTGQTTLNVTGNVFASNAVTTTNLFANSSLNVGPGTLGSNVVLFSNSSGGSNVFVMNSNGRIGIGTANPQSPLDVYSTVAAGGTPTITNSGGSLILNSSLNAVYFSVGSGIKGYWGSTNIGTNGNIIDIGGAANPFNNCYFRSLTLSNNLYASNALTTTNVFATTVSAANPIPFRNRIINGAMNIWQRNTAAISTTTSVYTTADRWCGALGTSGLILSQWPGPIEAPQFPYAFQVITSTTTSGVPLVEQRIENQNIPDFLNGTPVSVSFWVGQPTGTLMPLTVGLYYATAVNNFGTQTLAVSATQNTPTLTVANAYYSLSFTLTTSLGATNGLSLRFTTGGASATGSAFFLTGVQVEKGAFATPFEVRPYSTELALAQRYYYQLTSPTAAVQGSAAVYAIFGTATGITTTAFWLPIQFPVPMRTPNYTLSNSAVTNFQLLPTGTTTITSVGFQTDSFTPVGATLNFVGTNIVPTASYIFRTNNLTGSTTAFFGFSCEL